MSGVALGSSAADFSAAKADGRPRDARIRKGYADTRFGQVHYRTVGFRTSTPPLVLLHQTASSSVMFENMMADLAADYWVLAPDTPGFGGTFFPNEPATISYYAAVVRAFLSSLSIERAHFFGHHTGASIAVQLAYDSAAIAETVMLSGPPFLSEHEKRQRKASVEPIVLRDDGAHLLALWKRLAAKDSAADLPLRHREFVLNLHAGERYHEAYDAVFSQPFERQVAELTCPVLVMGGEFDTLRSSVEPAYRALRAGTMRILEGGTTYVCDRQAANVAREIRAFLRSQGEARVPDAR